MATAISKVRIIPMQAVNKRSPVFSPEKLGLVEAAIRENGGVVNNLIHPLECLSQIHAPEVIFENRYISRQIRPDVYNAYKSRLENAVECNLGPIFIFASREELPVIDEWLKNLNLFGPIVWVETQEKKSPVPKFGYEKSDADAWKNLIRFFKDLDITYIDLAGEKYYKESAHWTGCVFGAWLALRDFFDAHILREFTFPNVLVPRWGPLERGSPF